jgi:hypothetical protein
LPLDLQQRSHHWHWRNEDFVAELFEAPAQVDSALFGLIQVVVHTPKSSVIDSNVVISPEAHP